MDARRSCTEILSKEGLNIRSAIEIDCQSTKVNTTDLLLSEPHSPLCHAFESLLHKLLAYTDHRFQLA
jgi:hypothetical protein